MVDKKKLMELLKKDRIKISYKELNEVLNIYINLMRFYMRSNSDETYFAFLDDNIAYYVYDEYNDNYYNVFVNLIKLKRNNMLNYLDYLLVATNTRMDVEPNPVDIVYLSNYISVLLDYYNLDNKKYRGTIRARTEKVIDSSLHRYLDVLKGSKYVSSCYIEIISTYYDLVSAYFYDWDDDDNYNIDFDDYLELTFFYFVENNLLQKEPESVLAFLKTNDDIHEYILEKMALAGLKSINYYNEEFINCIDTLYNNSKIKRIVIR